MPAPTLRTNYFIAAVAPVRMVRTAGSTAAVNACEGSCATLLSILAGRVVAKADRGFAGQIGRHEENNSALGDINIASSPIGIGNRAS